MNESQFLFVTCVSNEMFYKSCVDHINQLRIPPHYRINLFPVYGAKSMAEGYNRALSHPSKYKIYLHQDTNILHLDILSDLLSLFQINSKLGMLGVIGCKYLSSTGIWWEGSEIIGKLVGYHEEMYSIMRGRDPKSVYERVQAVDGFFLATQYDLPWIDIGTGFHFYDISQPLEFQKYGYDVGVPYQREPWTMHINKEKTEVYDKEEYEKCQNIFLAHYGEHLQQMQIRRA